MDRYQDQEGLGLVAIEAMGCECAVVASSLEAIKDIIEDGETGLFCVPADADSLAERIGNLLLDQELQSRLAANGRKAVLARYDWQIITEKYSQLIEKNIKT